MPLQNRVTPFGEIVALSGRGLVIGNRGVLHDDSRHIVRHSQVRRWIACRLAYRGIRRQIMRPRRWTELFFLDEAVALSAGHRPCAQCRNADFKRFRTFWEGLYGAPARADAIDRVLHAARVAHRKKVTYRADVRHLPDGAFVLFAAKACLMWRNALHEWSDTGYAKRHERPASGDIEVLTPQPILAVLSAGYRPTVHPTAGPNPP